LLSRLTELLWGKLGDRFLILVTGTFVKQYSQWRHYEAQLQRDLKRLSPEVARTLRFLNGVRREQMAYFYSTSDIVVIPTFAYEATSFSAIEAMAHGKPVVATNVGGLNDVIDDGASGVLVPPHARHLANAIYELTENPDLRGRLGKEARRRAMTCFSLEIWRERVSKFIHSNGWCD
jgi:glycosyltransferase involved in cell wall biosynthesis